MKKILTAISVLFFLSENIKAQVSDEDVLRFSQLNFGGTSRSLGSGGAFGALGADFSALGNNPAGLGVYQHGEFTFSPSFAGIKTSSSFLGSATTDHKYNFNISNLGLVWCVPAANENSKWKSWNFGIGENRLNSYQESVSFTGFNENNSLLDRFLQDANIGSGIDPNSIGDGIPFTAGLAYNTYLINPMPADSNYYNSVVGSGQIQQTENITWKGATNEWVFSFAGNYNNKLYLGATWGLPSVYFHQQRNHEENDVNNLWSGFQSFNFQENITQSGVGMNGKFGLIYRANDYFRIGFAAHTPTFYWMDSRYSTSIDANLESSSTSYSSPKGNFKYNMVTPWRWIGSAAVLFGKYGFISADYEMVDYSSGSVDFNYGANANDIAAANNINSLVQAKYTAASNFKLGAEFAYDIFRIRGGMVLMQSPFVKGQNVDGADYSRNAITAGIGIRESNYFFDVAMVHATGNEYYQPYSLDTQAVPGATINKSSNTFSATLGLRF